MLEATNIDWVIKNKPILQNVSLKIEKGECVGLVGPNGSGKSSLLKILSFLEPPTKGKILLEGQELPHKTPLSIRRRIAVVFQEPLLFKTSVFQNVAAGLKMRKLPATQIRPAVEYWLNAFGISHLSKQHALSLSGGEAQRVSLARAFALNPEILFLDEPFSSLDAPTIEDLLVDLNRVFESTGITSLIVSHNFRDISRLTNKVIVMLNGKVKASGTTTEIFSCQQDLEVQNFLAHWQ